jgi:hypothetical protein
VSVPRVAAQREFPFLRGAVGDGQFHHHAGLVRQQSGAAREEPVTRPTPALDLKGFPPDFHMLNRLGKILAIEQSYACGLAAAAVGRKHRVLEGNDVGFDLHRAELIVQAGHGRQARERAGQPSGGQVIQGKRGTGGGRCYVQGMIS